MASILMLVPRPARKLVLFAFRMISSKLPTTRLLDALRSFMATTADVSEMMDESVRRLRHAPSNTTSKTCFVRFDISTAANTPTSPASILQSRSMRSSTRPPATMEHFDFKS